MLLELDPASETAKWSASCCLVIHGSSGRCSPSPVGSNDLMPQRRKRRSARRRRDQARCSRSVSICCASSLEASVRSIRPDLGRDLKALTGAVPCCAGGQVATSRNGLRAAADTERMIDQP